MNGAEKKAILKARAIELAVESAGSVGQGILEVMEFLLGPERYAFEPGQIQEVLPLKELTPIPGTPAFVLGIINIHGQIVSVIDLKTFFGLPNKGLTDLNKVILLSDGKMEFGVLADAVVGLHQISTTTLKSALPILSGMKADLIKCITPEGLVVLDSAKLLTDPRMIVRYKNET